MWTSRRADEIAFKRRRRGGSRASCSSRSRPYAGILLIDSHRGARLLEHPSSRLSLRGDARGAGRAHLARAADSGATSVALHVEKTAPQRLRLKALARWLLVL